MNTDEKHFFAAKDAKGAKKAFSGIKHLRLLRSLRLKVLSVFICVHLWTNFFSPTKKPQQVRLFYNFNMKSR